MRVDALNLFDSFMHFSLSMFLTPKAAQQPRTENDKTRAVNCCLVLIAHAGSGTCFLGSEIAALLDILGDEKWHLLAELQEQIGIATHKVQRIAAFLSMFGFVLVDETNERVKISRDFQEFLART
jgi:hypothetical protein